MEQEKKAPKVVVKQWTLKKGVHVEVPSRRWRKTRGYEILYRWVRGWHLVTPEGVLTYPPMPLSSAKAALFALNKELQAASLKSSASASSTS